jgi:hypothetical protein
MFFMIKKCVIYTILGISLCTSWNFVATVQAGQIQTDQVEPGLIEVQDFDEYDAAVAAAICSGMLKSKPEMRKPSSVEIVARKFAAFLLMRYLSLKDFLGSQVTTVKSYWASRK